MSTKRLGAKQQRAPSCPLGIISLDIRKNIWNIAFSVRTEKAMFFCAFSLVFYLQTELVACIPILLSYRNGMRPFGHVTGCRHCAKADRGLLRHRNKKILILLSEYAEHDSHVGWVKASTPRAGRHWFPLRHTPKPCSWGYSTKTRAPATP